MNRNLILSLIILFSLLGGLNGMSKKDQLPEDEFARRRAIFMDELQGLNAVAILHSAPVFERNHDIEHPYRQDSDFFYLSAWPNQDAILVLSPGDTQERSGEVVLYIPPRDPKKEVWTGPRPGIDEALGLPGIDQAYPYDQFFEHLQKHLTGKDRLVISYGGHKDFREAFQTQFDQSYTRPSIVQEAASLIKKHRLIKSEHEIMALEKAIAITGASFLETLPMISTFTREYEAKAMLEYGFAKRGARRLGFPSIVGAGRNTTFLHYEDDRDEMQSGDLLLIDMGAEWDYYSADISRTVPVSGTFSSEQAAIYQLVLDAQLAAIETVKPGESWRQPHNTAIQVITSGLVDLGLLAGDVTTLIQEKAYRKFFMHGTSHWLGLDVHDSGGYLDESGEPHQLKPGMVLTIEPGIYISESEDIPESWWHIGVRIEDDVLVTAKGHRVLSQSIPKTMAEIEQLMSP